MASGQEYLAFIKEQLSGISGVTFKPMMGEYLLYICGKLSGGIYDDRLLIKPTEAALRLLPDAPRERPYAGAKEMLLVERTDDSVFLCRLLTETAEALPEPRKKK